MSSAIPPSPPGSVYTSSSTSSSDSEEWHHELKLQLELLKDSPSDDDVIVNADSHEIRTAPIFTREAFEQIEWTSNVPKQFGLLGRTLSISSKTQPTIPTDPRLYVNTNAPFSAVVCGVQGSGKSHSVAVLLENMLVPGRPAIGQLEKPLSALVLHMGEGGTSSRPSEAAWVGVPHPSMKDVKCPPVRVYVSNSCLETMRSVYAPLGNGVTVKPLLFHESELDAQAFLSLMAVGSSSTAPLYVQIILSILRDLGENFTYRDFKSRLELRKRDFNPAQISGLELRMSLMQSFITTKGTGQKSRFAAGKLTIVDLSDTFIDPESACGLFEILTRSFVRANVGTGKVLVVDEAHKVGSICLIESAVPMPLFQYLSSNYNQGLTRSLLTLIREQRHLAMRVIISTQEPTVIPSVLLDLCTVTILHRFSSPSWWTYLAKHVSADVSSEDAFDIVVRLKTGEAVVLAPSALTSIRRDSSASAGQILKLGRQYLHMRTRRRVTMDGGASVLVLT